MLVIPDKLRLSGALHCGQAAGLGHLPKGIMLIMPSLPVAVDRHEPSLALGANARSRCHREIQPIRRYIGVIKKVVLQRPFCTGECLF